MEFIDIVCTIAAIFYVVQYYVLYKNNRYQKELLKIKEERAKLFEDYLDSANKFHEHMLDYTLAFLLADAVKKEDYKLTEEIK